MMNILIQHFEDPKVRDTNAAFTSSRVHQVDITDCSKLKSTVLWWPRIAGLAYQVSLK